MRLFGGLTDNDQQNVKVNSNLFQRKFLCALLEQWYTNFDCHLVLIEEVSAIHRSLCIGPNRIGVYILVLTGLEFMYWS